MYRAFFAIPNLRAPDGIPTGAVYGFVNMLNKVIREERPTFLVLTFDAPGPTFRHQLYEGYKAGRDAQPEDLSAQLPLVRELADAFRIPIVEVPGVEADDVIATLTQSVPEDVAVTIVSTDKDLMQLVSERVTLTDGLKERRYGPAEVEERFGVPPERMLDLRALVGDPSDNIPGVKGIGAKGAAKLIGEWGSLENLLDHAGEVKSARARTALIEQAETARLSKRLSTLRRDVPLSLPLEALAHQSADLERLRELYRRLGFGRLLEGLGEEIASDPPIASQEIAVELILDRAALERGAKALAAEPVLALVLVAGEGSAVDAPLVGVALASSDQSAVYLPLVGEGLSAAAGLSSAEALEGLRPLFEAEQGDRVWVGCGVKQVQSVLAEHGLELPPPASDIELAAFLLDPAGQQRVETLASRLLGWAPRSWEELAGRGAKALAASDLPVEPLADWAGQRACALRRLVAPLRERLEKDGLLPLFDEVEMPLTRVLSRVERSGVRIDEAKLAALSQEYEVQLSSLEAEIYELAGERFLVNSPKQLQRILFEKLKLSVVKKTKTGYSTDESVLEKLAAQHELPARILAWRRLAKLKSTYIDALPPLVSERSGRIHPVFHQTGAATGRLSASNPNVQNIPIRSEEGVRIREAFIPAEGCRLVSADYSQIELRILAHYSADENLLDAFHKGEDIHRRTAAEVAGIDSEAVTSEQRSRAKAVNFGIIYGSSAFGLANQLGIATAEAQETIDAYFERYRGVRRFLDETLAGAVERGYVTTLLGRRRYLPDLASRNRVLRQAAERMAVNTVIQGSEADLIKRAMVELDAALEDHFPSARMILQVHDELVFEVPTSEVEGVSALARARMEGVYKLRVPLVVDVHSGGNWREAH